MMIMGWGRGWKNKEEEEYSWFLFVVVEVCLGPLYGCTCTIYDAAVKGEHLLLHGSCR